MVSSSPPRDRPQPILVITFNAILSSEETCYKDAGTNTRKKQNEDDNNNKREDNKPGSQPINQPIHQLTDHPENPPTITNRPLSIDRPTNQAKNQLRDQPTDQLTDRPSEWPNNQPSQLICELIIWDIHTYLFSIPYFARSPWSAWSVWRNLCSARCFAVLLLSIAIMPALNSLFL